MNKIYQKSFSGEKNAGFTLIELLVVVLIIGILASVALPQYTKVVWKSRAAELRTVTRSLATAQEVFFLANSAYPRSFDEMDIDIPLENKGRNSQCGLTTQDSRGNNKYELIVNNHFGTPHYLSSSMFLDGPYKCGGFVFVHPQTASTFLEADRMYCWERAGSEFKQAAGSFCEKVMGGQLVGSQWGYRLYELP